MTTDPASRHAPVHAVAVACSGLVLVALPMFLVSGLAVQIRAELGFSESALGLAVATAFVVSASSAPFSGRLADRIGPRAAVTVGATVSSLSLVGLALVVGWWQLAALMAVAGLAMALTDPGLAILLSRHVSPERHGIAFGAKEASIPTATLIAGVAVPMVALTVGWRWAFALALLPIAALAILLPRIGDAQARRRSTPTGQRRGPAPRPPTATLVTVALATALGMAAASGVSVFLTQSAVVVGFSDGAAGLLLAAGSAAGVVTRIVMGVVADRNGGQQFTIIAMMIALGAVAIGLGALGSPLFLAIAAIGAFAGGWGWSGLLFLSLVRVMPQAPGAAAGVGISGLAGGNAIGPLVFGLIAERVSYPAAWLTAAALAVAAAALMRRAGAQLPTARSTTSRRPPAPDVGTTD